MWWQVRWGQLSEDHHWWCLHQVFATSTFGFWNVRPCFILPSQFYFKHKWSWFIGQVSGKPINLNQDLTRSDIYNFNTAIYYIDMERQAVDLQQPQHWHKPQLSDNGWKGPHLDAITDLCQHGHQISCSLQHWTVHWNHIQEGQEWKTYSWWKESRSHQNQHWRVLGKSLVKNSICVL